MFAIAIFFRGTGIGLHKQVKVGKGYSQQETDVLIKLLCNDAIQGKYVCTIRPRVAENISSNNEIATILFNGAFAGEVTFTNVNVHGLILQSRT